MQLSTTILLQAKAYSLEAQKVCLVARVIGIPAFPYVECERLSAERVVRAPREGRQSGNGSRFEKARISIPSVPPLGPEGQNRTSGHRNPNAKIECQAFTRDGGGVNISIWIDDALSVSPVLNKNGDSPF
jgi:hypothetical protein